MSVPYFNYSFDSETVNSTIITNNIVSHDIPVTDGLYMRLEGKNYDEKTKTWYDSGGAGRHIPPSSITGTPYLSIQGSNTNGSSKRSFQVLKGTTAEIINFGNPRLEQYTFFYIARYGGTTKQRIFTAAGSAGGYPSPEWHTGFWGSTTSSGYSGYAQHGVFLNGAQPSSSIYSTDFFIGCDCSNSLRTNGIERGTTNGTVTYLPNIIVNGVSLEKSDFEIADIIIYNRYLSLDERIQMENYLASIYGISASSTSNSNFGVLLNTPTIDTTDYKFGTASLKLAGGASGTSSQHVQLPPCRLGTNGVSFACWFRSQNSLTAATYPRIFDFGISATKVSLYIEGGVGKLGLFIPDLFTNADGAAGNTLILSNGPYVLDNVWRHVVWTISPDGTQKVYINGLLNYTSTRFVYPQNYDFTTNYIGKSNATDIFFNGAIDEFKFYKSTLTEDEIYNLYDHNNTYPTITPTTTIPTPYLYYNFDPSGTLAGNMGTYVLNKGTSNQTVSPNTTFAQNYQWTTRENCPIVWTASGSSFMSSATLIGGKTSNYEPYRIFDGSSNGGWVSQANSYYLQSGGTIGNYRGTTTTTANSVGTINGEWLQIQSSMPVRMLSYRFDSYYDNSNALACALPQTYYILGSNNGTTWDPIQYVVNNYASTNDASSNVNYTNTYTITNNTVATATGNYNSIGFATIQGFSTSFNYYSYFRLCVNSVFGKRLGYTNIQSTITNDFLAIGDWIIKFYPQYYYDAVLGSSGLLQQSDYRIPNTQVVTNAKADQYIRLPTFSTDVSGITFTCWFRSNNNSTYARLFDFANSLLNDGNNNLLLYFNNSYIGFSINQYYSYSQNNNIVPEINDNIWRHVAWTINTNGISTLYINGQSVYTIKAFYPHPISRTTNFLLKSLYVADPSYNGAIDEFAMYKTVLSDTAISAIYDSTKTIYNYYNDGSNNQIASTYVATPDLYYTFDSDTVRDNYLANKTTGVYDTIMSKDTIIDTTDYKIGNGSIALDGLPNTYVQLPKLSATGINGLTFTCWFRSNGNFDNTPIFDFGNGLVADNISAKINRNNLTLTVNNDVISPYIYNPYFHYKFNSADVVNYTLKNYGGGATDISGQYDAFIGVGASTIVDYTNTETFIISPNSIDASSNSTWVTKTNDLNFAVQWDVSSSSIYAIADYNNFYAFDAKSTVGTQGWVSGNSPMGYAATNGNVTTNTYGIGTQWSTAISGLVENNITILNLSGEWLEIKSSIPCSMKNYNLVSRTWSYELPRTYYIFGSNDRTTWYPIHYVTRSGGSGTSGTASSGYNDGIYTTPTYTIDTNTVTQTNVTSGVTSTYNSYSTSLNTYQYFRILVRAIGGYLNTALYTSIGEWNINFTVSKSLGPTINNILSKQNTQSESLILNGADNQKITLPAFTSGQDGLTFSFWMRSDLNTAGNNGAKIMDLGNDSKTDNITMSIQNNSLCCDVYNNGISSSVNSVLKLKPLYYYNFDDNTVIGTSVANLATGNLTQFGNTFSNPTEANLPYPMISNLYNGASVKGKVLTLSRTSQTNSSSQFMKLPSINLDSTLGLTMGCWFRTTDTSGTYPRILTMGNDSGTTYQVGFGMTTGRKLTVFSRDTVFRYWDPCYILPVNDGVWRHIMFTITGGTSGTSGATWKVYLNGVFLYHYKSQYYINTGTRTYNYIGRSNNSSDSTFDGQVSEMFVSNSVLTAEEVYSLYSNNSAFFYGLNDNNWRHYAWTIANNSLYNTPFNVKISNSTNSLTTSTWKLYVNGVLAKTLSNMNFPNNISRIYNYICGSNTATDPSFNGALDDFRMYKSVLSDADILSIYKNPSYSNVATTSTMKNDNIVSNINDNKWRHLAWSIDTSANWKIYMNGDLYSTLKGVYPNNIDRYLNFFGKLSKNPDTIDSSYSTFTPNTTAATTNTWTNNGVRWTSSASSFWLTTYSHDPYRAFNTTTTDSYDAWHIYDNVSYDSWEGTYNRTTYSTYINSIGLVYGEWLQIQSSIPLVMKSYILSSRSGFYRHMPRIYYIVGSNDNSTWYPIQYVSTQQDTAPTSTVVSTNTLYVSTGYYLDTNTSSGGSLATYVYGYPTSTNTYTYFRIIPTTNFAAWTTGANTITTVDRYVAIGEWNITFSNAVSKNFAGAIDDFRMYKRTLTDTEVSQITTVNPLFFHYRFDQSDVNGQSLANMATGSPIYDASLSTTGLINTTDFKTGNASLALTTDGQEYPPGPLTGDTTFIYYGSYGQGRYDVSYSSQFGTATNENAVKVFSKEPTNTWTANQWTNALGSYTSLTSIYSTNNALGHTGTYNTVVSGISISGEWIQLKMPNAIVLNKYMIIGETGRSINSFVLAGSNDGNTWSLIDEQRNLGIWSLSYPNCTMYFTPSSAPPSYNYFRLIITSIAATANATTVNYVTIRQIKYFAKPEQYVTLPSFWTGYNGLTFAMWLKLNNVPNISNAITTIFEFAPSNSGLLVRNNYIGFIYNTNSMRFNIYNGIIQYNTIFDISMNDNAWRHVAWTIDTNGFWKIYINGRLVKSESNAYPNNIQRYNNFLGKSIQQSQSYNLNGGLDDFRMYKSVLTDQDVMALYKESNKLLIHYTFDKETVNGSSVGDMVGTPAQLTIANGLDFKNTIISPNSTSATTMNGWSTTYDNRVYNWRASASTIYNSGSYYPYLAFNTTLTDFFHTNSSQTNTQYNSTTGIYIGDTNTNVQTIGNIGGEWLQINCDVPIVMSSYYLVGRDAYPEQFVRSHYIIGSNDGINWYPIQYSTRTGSISGTDNSGTMWTWTTVVATGSRTTPIINVTPYSYDIADFPSPSTLKFKLNGYSYANNPYTMFRMIFTESVSRAAIALSEWQIYAYEPLTSQPIYGSELTPTTYYANSNVATGIWANDGVIWSSSASSMYTTIAGGNTWYMTKAFNGRNGNGTGVYQGWASTPNMYASSNSVTNSYTGSYNTYIQTVGTVSGEYLQINSSIPVQMSNYFFTTLAYTSAINTSRYLPQEYYIVGSLDGSSQWYPIQYVYCYGGSTTNALATQSTDIYYTTTKLGETQSIKSKTSDVSGVINIYNYPVYALGYYTSFRVVVKNTFGTSSGLTDTTRYGETACIGQWNIKFNPHIINPYKYRLGNASLNLQAPYGEFLTIPTIQTLGSDGISFSLWFSSDGTQEGSQIMELGNGYNNNNILMYISNGNLYFGINNGNSSNTVSYDTMIATKILDGNWRNIVVLITTDGTWTFYVNGQFVKTVTGVYPFDVPRYINYLGKSSVRLDPYFNGYIDDFRVYKTVLTTTEIAEIYNSTGTSALDANGLTGFQYNGIDFSKLYKRKYTEYAGIINTIAGGGTTRGDGGLATNASLAGGVYDMAIDNSNNYIYFSLLDGNYVRRIDSSGIITTVVGTGVANSSGDGGLAINASVNGPSGLALDTSMNLFIAERYGNRIRKIDTFTGKISTIAGTMQPIAASTSDLSGYTVSTWVVSDISFTASLSSTRLQNTNHKAGNPFIYTDITSALGIASEETYNLTTGLYTGKRNTTGLPASMGLTLNTLSGEWLQLYSSQPVRMISYNLSVFNYFPASNRTTNLPQSYYILGSNDTVSWYPIQKVDCSYMSVDISSLCPTLTYNVTTNYGVQQIGPNPNPNSIGYGAYLNYSYADNSYNYFRISFQKTFGQNGGGAGTGAPLGWGNQLNIWDGSFVAIGKWAINFQADCSGTTGSYGDGMLANSAAVNRPIDIKLDPSNNIYITEFEGQRIRKIDASSGIITSLLGYISPNSANATAKNWIANGTQWDASASDYSTETAIKYFPYWAFNNAVGNNTNSFVSKIAYSNTTGVTLGKYIGTTNTSVIFNSGTQSIAGEWLQIHSGTPCQFISHSLSPWTGDGVSKVGSGLPASYTIVGSIDGTNWYPIQDVSCGWASTDDTITPAVTQTYVVSTNSSTIRYGTPGTKGDVFLTGYPTAANYYTYFRLIGKEIFNARMGFTTSWQKIYISEWNINFLGGGGYGGVSASTVSSTGDLSLNGTIIGGIAGNATMNYPFGLAFDASRNLYVGEYGGHRIRKLLLDTSGIITSMSPITTICGTGTMSHTGDGRYAINATIAKPCFFDIDSSNNILLSFDDYGVTSGSVVRMINGNNGIIDKIAGTDSSGYFGDGGFATRALLKTPFVSRFDKNRNIYISDNNNKLIRKITRQTAPPATNLSRNGVDIANTFSPKTGITTTQLINGIYNTNLQDNIEPIEQQAIPAKGRVFTDNNSWVVPANPVYQSGISPSSTNATSNTWTTTAGSTTITWVSNSSSNGVGFDAYKAFDSKLLVSNNGWQSTNNLYNTTTGYYNSNTYTYINGIGNVGGEWLQIQTSLPLSMSSYQLNSQITNLNALPRRYYIVGSNDKLTWYPIQYVNKISNYNGIINTSSTYTVDTRTNYIDTITGDFNETLTSDVTGYSTSKYYYTYFRMVVIQNCTSSTTSNTSIGEWIINGTVLTNPTGWQFSASTEDTSMNANAFNAFNNSTTTFWKDICGNYDLSSGNYCDIITPNSTNATSLSWSANGINWDASSSSFRGSTNNNLPYKAFNNVSTGGDTNTFVTNGGASASNAYNTLATNAGIYTGIVKTTVQTIGDISGEWLQIKASQPCQYLMHNLQSGSYSATDYLNSLLPARYYIVGSNDGLTWYPIQDISYGYASTADTSATVETTQTISMTTNTTPTYYGVTGAIGYVSIAGFSTSANYYTYFRMIMKELFGKRMGYASNVTDIKQTYISEWNLTLRQGPSLTSTTFTNNIGNPYSSYRFPVPYKPSTILIPMTALSSMSISNDSKRMVLVSYYNSTYSTTGTGFAYYSTSTNGTDWALPLQITLDATKRGFLSSAITSDGTRIAIGGNSSTEVFIFTWSKTSGSVPILLQTLNVFIAGAHNLNFNEDGSRLTMAGGGPVYIYFSLWNNTTNTYSPPRKTLQSGSLNIYQVDISKDGNRIVYVSEDGTTRANQKVYWAYWNGSNFTDGTAISAPGDNTVAPRNIKFNEDASVIYSTSVSSTATVFVSYYDYASNSYSAFTTTNSIPKYIVPASLDAWGVTRSENNKYLYVSGLVANTTQRSCTIYRLELAQTNVADGEWIQVKLPYQLKVTNYSIMNRPTTAEKDDTYNDPRIWWLLGSNDGSAWNLVDYRNDTASIGGAMRKFNVYTKDYYSYYRLVISAVSANTSVSSATIAQLFLNGIYNYTDSAITAIGTNYGNVEQILPIPGFNPTTNNFTYNGRSFITSSSSQGSSTTWSPFNAFKNINSTGYVKDNNSYFWHCGTASNGYNNAGIAFGTAYGQDPYSSTTGNYQGGVSGSTTSNYWITNFYGGNESNTVAAATMTRNTDITVPRANIIGLSITADNTRVVYCVYNTASQGLYFATIGSDGNWSGETSFDTTQREYLGMSISADGSRGVFCDSATGLYYFTWTGTTYTTPIKIESKYNRFYNHAKITYDGNRVVVSMTDVGGAVCFSVWNGNSFGPLTQTLETRVLTYRGIGISNDGNRLIYGSATSSTAGIYYNVYYSVWNGTNYTMGKQTLDTSSKNWRNFEFSNDNNILYGSTEGNATATLWVCKYNSILDNYEPFIAVPILTIPASLDAWPLFMSRDGNTLYCKGYTLTTLYRMSTQLYQAAGEWLQVQTSSPLKLANYRILSRNNDASSDTLFRYDNQRIPIIFYMLGSNDGSTWFLLDAQSLTTTQTTRELGSYSTSTTYATQYYTYFRLVVNKVSGNGNVVNLTNLQLFGVYL